MRSRSLVAVVLLPPFILLEQFALQPVLSALRAGWAADRQRALRARQQRGARGGEAARANRGSQQGGTHQRRRLRQHSLPRY